MSLALSPVVRCTASGFGTGGLLFLPCPIDQCTSADQWDYQNHKVPVSNGVSTFGHSLGGTEISLTGGMRKNAADVFETELEMFDFFVTMKNSLAKITKTTPAEFFFFYDTVTPTYRKMKRVYAASLTLEMGDPARNLYQWTATFLAEDPLIYTTAPGV